VQISPWKGVGGSRETCPLVVQSLFVRQLILNHRYAYQPHNSTEKNRRVEKRRKPGKRSPHIEWRLAWPWRNPLIMPHTSTSLQSTKIVLSRVFFWDWNRDLGLTSRRQRLSNGTLGWSWSWSGLSGITPLLLSKNLSGNINCSHVLAPFAECESKILQHSVAAS